MLILGLYDITVGLNMGLYNNSLKWDYPHKISLYGFTSFSVSQLLHPKLFSLRRRKQDETVSKEIFFGVVDNNSNNIR